MLKHSIPQFIFLGPDVLCTLMRVITICFLLITIIGVKSIISNINYVVVGNILTYGQISGQDKASANMAPTSTLPASSPLRSRFRPIPYNNMEDPHHSTRLSSSSRLPMNPGHYESGNLLI